MDPAHSLNSNIPNYQGSINSDNPLENRENDRSLSNCRIHVESPIPTRKENQKMPQLCVPPLEIAESPKLKRKFEKTATLRKNSDPPVANVATLRFSPLTSISASINEGAMEINGTVNKRRNSEWKYLAEERLWIQERLKNMYRCLVKVAFNQDLALQISKQQWFSCSPSVDSKNKASKQMQKALDVIYLLINRALSFGVYIFFDDDGHIITLSHIDKLAFKKYPDKFGLIQQEIREILESFIKRNVSVIRKIITCGEEETEYIHSLAGLHLPRDVEEQMTDRERYFARLLQRMYPLSELRKLEKPVSSQTVKGSTQACRKEKSKKGACSPLAGQNSPDQILPLEGLPLNEKMVVEEKTKSDNRSSSPLELPAGKDLGATVSTTRLCHPPPVIHKIEDEKTSYGQGENFPIVPPKILLVLFKNYIDLERLSLVAGMLINLPESYVPYMQKLMILNFFKNLLFSNIRSDNYFSVSSRMRKNRKYSLKFTYDQSANNKDFIIPSICDEIDILPTHSMKPFPVFETNGNPLNVSKTIEKLLLENDTDSKEFYNFLKSVSGDLKILAAMTFNNINFKKCIEHLKSKEEIDPALYSNNLLFFVKHSFLKLILKRSDSEKIFESKKIISEFYYLYVLFLRLSQTLLENHDHLTSVSIYCALSDKKLRTVFTNKKFPKVNNSLRGFIERMEKLLARSCQELKLQMHECNKLGVFFIPCCSLILERVAQRMEHINLHSDQENLSELEKFHLISNEMTEIDQIFDDIRFKVNMRLKSYPIQTDINNIIYKMSENDLKNYDALFDKIFEGSSAK